MAAKQQHSLLVERFFVGFSSSILGFTITTFGTVSLFLFLGLNLKPSLTITKHIAPRGFVWKVCRQQEDEMQLWPDDSNRWLKSLLLSLINVIYSLQHFSSSKGSNKANSIDFDRLLQLNLPKTPHVCCVCSLFWTGSSPIMTSQNPVPKIFRRFHEPFRS